MSDRQETQASYRRFTAREARTLNEARTVLKALASRAYMGEYRVPESTADGMIAARAEVAADAVFQVLNHVNTYGGWPKLSDGIVHNTEPAQTVAVVFNTESDPPDLVGTYEGTDEDAVCYADTSGKIWHAPQDCVAVVKVAVDGASGPQAAS